VKEKERRGNEDNVGSQTMKVKHTI
jgi:hypothetical protein